MDYNKLVIFDLDGVLIDSREMHFDALNIALEQIDPKYVISKEEHLAIYDGLPTTKKLDMLHKTKGLPLTTFNQVWKMKQEATQKLIWNLTPDKELIEICNYLKKKDYKIAVASNAIRKTVNEVLIRFGIWDYFDSIFSNDHTDMRKPKPYPEMYWRCMMACNAIPRTTFIIEDSHIGRQGAIDSGATLIPVESRKDLTLEFLASILDNVEHPKVNIPWRDSRLNVLIPMAGLGSRFANAGYTFPKPLIDVKGKPMIQAVVENLNIEANYIFIVQAEHIQKYNIGAMLRLIVPNSSMIVIDGLTEGAAVTTLYAKHYIDNDNPLLIANSDQIIDWNSNEVMYAFKADQIDGGILTFKSVHPKWSYVRLDEHGFAAEVAEKKPISDNATVGIYYWSKGSDYVKYAEQMINKNIRTNNEFYVAPVFNEAIADGKKIRIKEVAGMHGIGTPEDLEIYLKGQ